MTNCIIAQIGSMITRQRLAAVAVAGLLIILSTAAEAQELTLDLGETGSLSGRVLQFVALITILSLAPSILVMVTSFTRLIVVFSLMRSAIGIQQTPPNTVLVSLALFLTAFIMAPTLEAAYENGIEPLLEEEIEESEAFERAAQPFHEFMMRHVRDKDLGLFMELGRLETPDDPAAIPMRALIPAFMISELRRAFEIGFLIFIPFVVIDMVVASILMAMGMMMLPPIMISLPFKLIFFVLVDGWHLISGSLIQSYGL